MSIGADYAFFPDWIPAPQRDSWNFYPEELRSMTDTEVGNILRPQFLSDIIVADCSLVLNGIQSAWFETFEDAMIKNMLWFTMPVFYAGRTRNAKCMFKTRPKWSVDAFTTTYTFSILIQKRSLNT